ncbi:Hypothetical predicted protein [Xyrichtys novacula]|uniref:Uncharacterized protein n=1 Tax=Xyrichtys novacula TaxID=13765 RepID=A0AAV1G6U0_XYRNO|nr:Hypothetical predicted protein [Xyrichtys novacula]
MPVRHRLSPVVLGRFHLPSVFHTYERFKNGTQKLHQQRVYGEAINLPSSPGPPAGAERTVREERLSPSTAERRLTA